METKVYSAFPDVGKTTYFNTTNRNVLDSDSSKFDKKHFPDNYIDHIKRNVEDPKVDKILVSSHKDVRDALLKKGAEAKYLFQCEKCKCEFESRIYNVLTGYWCPYCKNKTEGKVAAYLQAAYPHYKSQVRFDWCRNVETNNVMPFDFGLEDEKVLIEVDGPQHFKQIAKWDAPESVRKKDIQKIRLCVEKGYSVIHILQKDIWTDRIDWKTILVNHH